MYSTIKAGNTTVWSGFGVMRRKLRLKMKEQLRDLVDQSLPEIIAELKSTSLEPEALQYEVELPKVKAHGDLSINLAFQLGRKLKRNPFEIAATCRQILEKRVKTDGRWKKCVREITVEKPGFINFRFSNRSF